MKIAAVSMTYNDGYKLKEWKEHYQTYKEQIDIFVIVDNGSKQKYLRELKKAFPKAVIIERKTNGGCTAAYNDGIRYVLKHTDAKAIAIVGNDIKVTENCLPAMYEYLFQDEKLGIVSTAVLNIDSDVIDNYGHKVKNFKALCCNQGESIKNVRPMQKYTELVSGGFTMAKREFYVKAGLQDEALFMYCDEIDTMFKAKMHGYKLGVIADEYAWHWHINSPATGRRSSASRYLISRNRVYLAKKYMGFFTVFRQVFRGAIISPAAFLLRFIRERDRCNLKDAKYSAIGAVHGVIGKMYTNRYTRF
ncbi:MAG: glycosyltransferase family 2 protein [Lachnospiraceae bacterium]|nr:glycosyltransferase family 2 protein [Lachnospiraceae bacterium]